MKMNRTVGVLLGVLLMVTGVANGQTPMLTKPSVTVEATPALWKVKGAKGTVYLFGTVHVMKKDVQWETAKVKDALDGSGTLWLEIADTGADAQAKLMPVVRSLGMDAAHPLSTKISKEDVATLDATMKTMGASEAAVEPMQPWLVYMTLAILPTVQAGYDPTSGVDHMLQVEATTAKKPIRGFETGEEQMHVLADMPQDQQVAMLHLELSELPDGVKKTNEMVAAWEKGDVEKIARMENDDEKEKIPQLYQRLLVDRNVAIAHTISGILKDPASGTVFVAIGAAHLAGPDSIQKLLEKDGFVAERVE
jgi:uncharacterized protein YbaP (TraB family)